MHKISNSDIEGQIKIIEFLGFNASKLNENSNYKITDEKGNEVGFIKYVQKEDSGHDECQYHIEINNDELRVVSGVKDVYVPSSPLNLEILFKKASIDIFIHMGAEYSLIKMHFPDNKIAIFYIDKNQFFGGCKEPYDSYLQQEVKVDSMQKIYTYAVSCLDIRDEKNDYPLYMGELKCQTVDQNDDLIEVKNTWEYWRGKEYNNKKPNYISTVQGTIEDVITKHQMGINAFNRMRFLMNTVQFKSEIIDFVVKNTQFELPGYIDLFIPEIKNKSEFKNLIKKN